MCVNWQEPDESVHVARSATPWLLVAENSTTPVGVVAVPVPVSVTFAVQVAVCPPTATTSGQLSEVEVERSESAEAVPRLSTAAVPTTTARAITTRAPRPTMAKGYDRPAIATPPDRLVTACPC
jgi:hypothetical protein